MDEKLKLILFDNGSMSELYKAGFVGTKPFLYRDVYLWIDAQKKTRGISEYSAILQAMDKFDKSENTIRRALKAFQ